MYLDLKNRAASVGDKRTAGQQAAFFYARQRRRARARATAAEFNAKGTGVGVKVTCVLTAA